MSTFPKSRFLYAVFIVIIIQCSLVRVSFAAQNVTQDATQNSAQNNLTVSAWIPYWSEQGGMPALLNHIKLFDSVSPFAYEVKNDGTLQDKLGIASGVWTNVINSARNNSVEIIPSILWGNKSAIHLMLTDATKRARQIQEIVSLVKVNNFNGIEIDYEGKLYTDKDMFSKFLQELSLGLKTAGKKLICTVEARTSDNPSSTTPAKALFPWANDYTVLNNTCDEVRIMAYDEYFTTYGRNTFLTGKPVSESVSNASIDYVRNVLIYATSRINKNKIILGIPTYGYEFSVAFKGSQRTVSRVRSFSFAQATAFAKSIGSIIHMTVGAEKYFIYTAKSGQTRYVVFSDSETIQNRLGLASQFGVKGISLFKIDGDEDPKMWDVLK